MCVYVCVYVCVRESECVCVSLCVCVCLGVTMVMDTAPVRDLTRGWTGSQAIRLDLLR